MSIFKKTKSKASLSLIIMIFLLGYNNIEEDQTEQILAMTIDCVLSIATPSSQTWSYSWSERNGLTSFTRHYAYIKGQFINVRNQETNWINLHPSYYPDQMIGVSIDSHLILDTYEFGEPRLKHITIFNTDLEIIQEIRDVRTNLASSHFGSPPEPMATLRFETFDAHFNDYTGNGYLDFAFATFRGGSIGNSPRRYWFWCANKKQFIENVQLTNLSDFGTISTNIHGNIDLHFREHSSLWAMLVFRYENGEFLLVD